MENKIIEKLALNAQKWANKNKWFGIDKKLTEKALTVHELIVNKLKINAKNKLYFLLVDLFMEKYLKKNKKWKKQLVVTLMEKIIMLFIKMKMVIQRWFWNQISKLGCYLSNLSWRKLYRVYKPSRKALK